MSIFSSFFSAMRYRENRSRIPLAELAKYRGRWLAFRLDGRRIIASGEDLGQLDALVVAAGEDPEQRALERIELDDVCLRVSVDRPRKPP